MGGILVPAVLRIVKLGSCMFTIIDQLDQVMFDYFRLEVRQMASL